MNMIEQMARAIAPKAWAYFDRGDQTMAQEHRRTASLRHARAALAAAREPTDTMRVGMVQA